jgi:hypothetical protein
MGCLSVGIHRHSVQDVFLIFGRWNIEKILIQFGLQFHLLVAAIVTYVKTHVLCNHLTAILLTGSVWLLCVKMAHQVLSACSLKVLIQRDDKFIVLPATLSLFPTIYSHRPGHCLYRRNPRRFQLLFLRDFLL